MTVGFPFVRFSDVKKVPFGCKMRKAGKLLGVAVCDQLTKETCMKKNKSKRYIRQPLQQHNNYEEQNKQLFCRDSVKGKQYSSLFIELLCFSNLKHEALDKHEAELYSIHISRHL